MIAQVYKADYFWQTLYVSALMHFIEDYEARESKLNLTRMSPLELLKYLLEQNDLNTTDLGHIVGSRGLASEILSGKRGLSKTIIHCLVARFQIDPAMFLE